MMKEQNSQVTVKHIPFTKPPDNLEVKYVLAGGLLKIKGCTKTRITNSVRISATQYRDSTTGEIKDYKQRTVKNSRNFNRQFENLAYLIASNFSGDDREVHIVLTYRNGENNRDIVGKDLKSFMKKLRYRFKDKFPGMEYIAVYEQHASGGWHIHVLLKAMATLYIPWNKLVKLWGHGQAYIKKNYICDKNPYYFSVFTEQVNVVNQNGNKIIKMQGKKAKRLAFYPQGKKLYSKSKGIITPICGTQIYSNLSEWLTSLGIHATYNDKKQIILKDEEIEKIINTVYIESYYLDDNKD